MKLCSSCAGEVCDFCIWYAFNGEYFGPDVPPPLAGIYDTLERRDELSREHNWAHQVYTGDGFCRIDGRSMDPEDGCENFVCGNWQREVEMVGSPWEVMKMRLARGMWGE